MTPKWPPIHLMTVNSIRLTAIPIYLKVVSNSENQQKSICTISLYVFFDVHLFVNATVCCVSKKQLVFQPIESWGAGRPHQSKTIRYCQLSAHCAFSSGE